MSDFNDEDEAGPRTPAEDLRRVARYQRWVIATVLSQVTLWVGCLVLGAMNGTGLSDGMRLPMMLTVILGCVGGVYSFLIYWTVGNPFWAVVMGLACIPPLIGLLTLTVVNGTATRTLAADGLSVGFFGADIDAIEDTPGLYDEDAGW